MTFELSRRRALLELFALCGFAFTQPLLDVFGRAPDLFVLRGTGTLQIIVFALLLAVGPALVLWLLELGVRAVSVSWHRRLHLGLLGALTTIVVYQLLSSRVTGGVVWVVAALLALVLLIGYRSFAPVRLWVGYLAVGPIAVVVLFLLTSRTSELLGGDPALPAVEVGAPAPVVVIVLDELPLSALMDGAGAIDRELYPNLASLADDAHWYRNATSVAPGTYHAVPAILTGDMSETGQGPGASDHPHNLFTLLGSSYDVHGGESITRLCPEESCPRPSSWAVLGDLAVDVKEAMESRLGMGRHPDRVAALAASTDPARTFETFVDDIGPDPRTLHVLHLLLPHRPFRYLPDGRTYPNPDPEIGLDPGTLVWSDDPWPGTLGRQRLVLQTQAVDRLLGSTFDRLRELDLYDDSLIVVTADHGLSFDPGTIARPVFGEPLSETSVTDLLWVPLLIKEPGQRQGTVSDANALTIDVVPTIADILDVEPPWPLQGRSLLGAPRPGTDKPWRPTKVGSATIDVGEEVTVDGARGFEDLFTRTLDQLLPPAGAPERVWRVGPRSELLGRRVEDLARELTSVEAHLLDEDEPDGDGDVLALVRAEGGDLEVGDQVAVAVDGVVAATATVFEEAGEPQLAVMVDPDRLDGEAAIEVFRIS